MCQVGVAVYRRYSEDDLSSPPLSYLAHISGSLAGVSIGLVILNNFQQKLWERYEHLFLELLSQLKMNRILDKLLQVSTDTVDSPVPGGDSLLYPDVSPLPSDRQRPD